MKTLIAGLGEVGSALAKLLEPVYPTRCFDTKAPSELQNAEVLHVCFPWQEGFVEKVRGLQARSEARWTVIHSTVPPGTSAACGALHSPVIGIHPFLEQSLRTFTKFISGPHASEIAEYFRRAGMKVYLVDRQETTELMKILDTTFYGLSVEFTKEVKRQCDQRKVPFEAWTLWTQNYNRGYEALGHPEFQRPNLVPIMGRIGGHCVLQNCELLESEFTKFMKEGTKEPSKEFARLDACRYCGKHCVEVEPSRSHPGTLRLWVSCDIQQRLFPGECYPKDPFRTEWGTKEAVEKEWNARLGVNSTILFDEMEDKWIDSDKAT